MWWPQCWGSAVVQVGAGRNSQCQGKTKEYKNKIDKPKLLFSWLWILLCHIYFNVWKCFIMGKYYKICIQSLNIGHLSSFTGKFIKCFLGTRPCVRVWGYKDEENRHILCSYNILLMKTMQLVSLDSIHYYVFRVHSYLDLVGQEMCTFSQLCDIQSAKKLKKTFYYGQLATI